MLRQRLTLVVEARSGRVASGMLAYFSLLIWVWLVYKHVKCGLFCMYIILQS